MQQRQFDFSVDIPADVLFPEATEGFAVADNEVIVRPQDTTWLRREPESTTIVRVA